MSWRGSAVFSLVTLKPYGVVPVNQTSEVYVKVNGAWKIRVDHASFVPPPQPPPPAAITAGPSR